MKKLILLSLFLSVTASADTGLSCHLSLRTQVSGVEDDNVVLYGKSQNGGIEMSDGTFGYAVRTNDDHLSIDVHTSNGDQLYANMSVNGVRRDRDTLGSSSFTLKLKAPIAVKVRNRYAPSGYVDGTAASVTLVCSRN